MRYSFLNLLIAKGSLFHSFGAATEKALSQIIMLLFTSKNVQTSFFKNVMYYPLGLILLRSVELC